MQKLLQCYLHSCASLSSSCCAQVPHALWCFFLCTCFLGMRSPLHVLTDHHLPLAVPAPAGASSSFPSQAAAVCNGDSNFVWRNPRTLWSRAWTFMAKMTSFKEGRRAKPVLLLSYYLAIATPSSLSTACVVLSSCTAKTSTVVQCQVTLNDGARDRSGTSMHLSVSHTWDPLSFCWVWLQQVTGLQEASLSGFDKAVNRLP